VQKDVSPVYLNLVRLGAYPRMHKNLLIYGGNKIHMTKNPAKNKMNILDLFCGCGGLSLGFERAGFAIAVGIDNDSAALRTFEANHAGAKSICGDITEITYKKNILPLLNGKQIDIVIGGPPCQGMSLSGLRKFNDPRNRLYLSYIRLVKEIDPRVFVIENVPGLQRLFGGAIKENIIKEFTKLGYDVQDRILCASDYGVPQNRHRIVFVGIKKSLANNMFSFPVPSESVITCEMALSDLPTLEDDIGEDTQDYTMPPDNQFQKLMRTKSTSISNHIAARHSDHVKNIISLVPDGGNYKDLPPEYINSRNFHVAWTRFASDKPAPTIDTGHRHHFHYKMNRVPTVRECARIQSFPDDFIFFGNKTEQFRQVGNAVPPLMAEKIANQIKEIL
jgi:DNA (cytosine-5)-methyltransferase 1